MRLIGFLARIHVDRFTELRMLIGKGEMDVDIVSFGLDHTVEVFISGEEEDIFSLNRSVRRLSGILSSAPVWEEV